MLRIPPLTEPDVVRYLEMVREQSLDLVRAHGLADDVKPQVFTSVFTELLEKIGLVIAPLHSEVLREIEKIDQRFLAAAELPNERILEVASKLTAEEGSLRNESIRGWRSFKNNLMLGIKLAIECHTEDVVHSVFNN